MKNVPVVVKLPLPPEDLSIPILIPFQLYNKPMLECESLKVSVVVTNKLEPDRPYLAEDDVVLADPPISVTVSTKKTPKPKLCLKSPAAKISGGFKLGSKGEKNVAKHFKCKNATISRDVLILSRCKNSKQAAPRRTHHLHVLQSCNQI